MNLACNARVQCSSVNVMEEYNYLKSRRDMLRLCTSFLAASVSAPSIAASNSELIAISEEVEGSDGQVSTISIAYPKNWKYTRNAGPLVVSAALRDACLEDPDKCILGDMLAKSMAGGDNVFLTGFVSGAAGVADIPWADVKRAIFGKQGKFAAFGAPDVIKVLSDKTEGSLRTIEAAFDAFSPGGSTLPKRALVALAMPAAAPATTAAAPAAPAGGGGGDVYALVVTSAAGKFKSSESTLRAVAGSLSVQATGRQSESKPAASKTRSMFAKDNEERAALERQRREEGLF